MKKNILKVSSLSIAGAVLVTINTMMIDAHPIAGVSLSINNALTSPIVQSSIKIDKAAVTGVSKSAKILEEQVLNSQDFEDDANEEKLPLNLNYDRLGIANVENYLNIREKPGEDQKIIGKLPKNAGCHIYYIKDGWAKIVSGKVTGYVSAEYLITDEKAEELAQEVGSMAATVTNTSTLRVRALPSEKAMTYSLVPEDEQMRVKRQVISEAFIDKLLELDDSILVNSEGEKVNIPEMKEQLSNWICVTIDNDIAFVSKDYITLSYELKRAVPIEELNTDGSSGVSSIRAQMVQYAQQFLGNRYIYGGTSLTSGTDCSGFTMRIYQHYGYGINRTAAAQSTNGTRISPSSVKPGDLLFYSNGYRINHVAMYIGNGQVIHASNPSDGIKISNMYYRSPVAATRIIND